VDPCKRIHTQNQQTTVYTPDVAESLTGVLVQCPVLVHLNLSLNRIGDAVTAIIMFSGEIEWSHSGAEILAGVLR
jgi:hypothetical protein